jgi:hypothetical protein
VAARCHGGLGLSLARGYVDDGDATKPPQRPRPGLDPAARAIWIAVLGSNRVAVGRFAAVGAHEVAVNVAGLVGGQEDGHVGDILGLAPALARALDAQRSTVIDTADQPTAQ